MKLGDSVYDDMIRGRGGISDDLCSRVCSSSRACPQCLDAERHRNQKVVRHPSSVVDEIPTLVFRDIYYKDVALFTDQRIVDRCIGDICRTIHVARANLNVVFSS